MAMTADNPDSGVRSGPGWRRAKDKARKRDQYRCQYCRRRDSHFTDLQVHHIKPVSEGGTNDLDNLVVLCNNCHWRLHNNFDDEEQLRPELLDDYEPATIGFKDYRATESNLTDASLDVLELLRENGPMQLKDIIEETGYSRGHVNNQLDRLKFGKFVCRVSRGVYAYIPTLAYREVKEKEPDEHGRRTVRVWDPGTQSDLSEWTDNQEEDNAE